MLSPIQGREVADYDESDRNKNVQRGKFISIRSAVNGQVQAVMK